MLALAGCDAKAADYSTIWSSGSPTPTTTAEAPSAAITIGQYLEQQGVDGVPMTPATLKELTVSMPRPPGWTAVNDPAQPSAFEIIRKTGTSAFPPTAQLLVFTLVGRVDPRETVKYGYADAERADQFKRLGASMDDFRGFPSAMIEGNYNLNGQTLRTYSRVVVPTGRPPGNQPYLVQFKVTTLAAEARTLGPEVEQIIKGFTVATR